MWLAMSSQIPPGAPVPGGADMFTIMGAAVGVVVIALFAIPLLIMIRYLRGSEARTATGRANS